MNEQAPLPTVRDVLALPVVASGLPEVLAGVEYLDRPVRWVHIADSIGVSTMLDGGELLLSTGTAWPDDENALSDYLALLIDAEIVGLIVELGTSVRAIPASVVALFEQAKIPLVALWRETPFIRITSVVHQRIIAGQNEALVARANVHSVFTSLSLRGSPLHYIVEELARELRTMVVLEDREHRVIEFAGGDETALEDWRATSISTHRNAERGHGPTSRVESEDGPWHVTAIEARGHRFGHLIVLPGPRHAAGRTTVIEQGAIALALHRLSSPDDDQWMLASHRRLLTGFITGRFRTLWTFSMQLEASGFPVTDRALVGLALTLDDPAALVRVTPRVIAAVARLEGSALATVGEAVDATSAILAVVSVNPLVGITDVWITRLAQLLSNELGPDSAGAKLVIGSVANRLDGLLESLMQAREGVRSQPTSRVGGLQVCQPTLRAFDHLWGSLQSDPRVQAFVAAAIGPLIEHDLAHDGDLIAVLGSYLKHPGNRSQAAQAASMSRSVFYLRLATIEDLLDVDLNDGGTIAGLHAAVTAHRARRLD